MEKVDIVFMINKLKEELDDGDVVKTKEFLNHVLSNGDVLVELEEQFEEELL